MNQNKFLITDSVPRINATRFLLSGLLSFKDHIDSRINQMLNQSPYRHINDIDTFQGIILESSRGPHMHSQLID